MWKVEIDEGDSQPVGSFVHTWRRRETDFGDKLCARTREKLGGRKKSQFSDRFRLLWWIRPGGDFQGEDLKLETSDKWRLAKRELICFLPDSLDNDIGINYEDEDGVESAGKLTQQKMGMIVKQETDPVQDGGPSLHGDALEDGEHGEDDVVEAGDPLVGTLPVLKAH